MPAKIAPDGPTTKKQSLGKYAKIAAKQLAHLGWVYFIKFRQIPSDINQTIRNIHHPAAPYLHRLAQHGVPAPLRAQPWTARQKQRAFKRGLHISAAHYYQHFLHEDMADYIDKRFWVVLPYHSVKDFPHLKLAPCSVVPQRN
jgi:hypothetical protein